MNSGALAIFHGILKRCGRKWTDIWINFKYMLNFCPSVQIAGSLPPVLSSFNGSIPLNLVALTASPWFSDP